MDIIEQEVKPTNGKEEVGSLGSSQQDSLTGKEQVKLERERIKVMLAEARNTREVLMEFRSAIETSTHLGLKAMAIAKGLSFLDAVIKQNQDHISNLQTMQGQAVESLDSKPKTQTSSS